MKTNIYDWPDEYNDIAESLLRFGIEHCSIHNMADALVPMEVHPERLLGHDFKKRYDMTKSYCGYPNVKNGENTLHGVVIKENYKKMENGTLHRWASSKVNSCGEECYDQSSNMGSETYRRMFDMGIVINMESINKIKAGLNRDENAVVDNMCSSKADLNKALSHYFIVIDRVMHLVSNLGLEHCYRNLYKDYSDTTDQHLKNNDISGDNTSSKPTSSVIDIYGGELPDDPYISCMYDSVGTNNGWRNVVNVKNIVQIHYALDKENNSSRNEKLAAIIGGYLAMRRLITWKIVIGDICGLQEAADEINKVISVTGAAQLGSRAEFESILMMLEHVDSICEYIDNRIKISELFDGEVDTTLTKAKLVLTQNEETTYRCIYKALSVMLSDVNGTCRLCMDKREEHTSITIIVHSTDNALISLRCHSNDRSFNKYMEESRSNMNDEAKPLEIDSDSINDRLDAILAKIRAGTLNQYVTKYNTCYLSDQQGKIIMPTIIDTFILRLCGINSYMAEDRHLIMIDKWTAESGIVQRPTHIRIGEIKMHGVVHLEPQEISDTKMTRNVGRQMIA